MPLQVFFLSKNNFLATKFKRGGDGVRVGNGMCVC